MDCQTDMSKVSNNIHTLVPYIFILTLLTWTPEFISYPFYIYILFDSKLSILFMYFSQFPIIIVAFDRMYGRNKRPEI